MSGDTNFKIEQLEYSINSLEQKNNEMYNLLLNTQMLINNMANVMNMQSQAINGLTDQTHKILLKTTDIEISNTNNESYAFDMQNNMQVLLNSIEDIKNKVENLRFIYYTE